MFITLENNLALENDRWLQGFGPEHTVSGTLQISIGVNNIYGGFIDSVIQTLQVLEVITPTTLLHSALVSFRRTKGNGPVKFIH